MRSMSDLVVWESGCGLVVVTVCYSEGTRVPFLGVGTAVVDKLVVWPVVCRIVVVAVCAGVCYLVVCFLLGICGCVEIWICRVVRVG